ncbi:MAG: DUF177 domain-containing protein [Pseudomonadota bacterium]
MTEILTAFPSDVPLTGRDVLVLSVAPDAPARRSLANALGLLDLQKLTFTMRLEPVGARDWALKGQLATTVVQPCGISLDPVKTRLDFSVERNYCADYAPPEQTETEMPEDDTAEPLVTAIALEALVLEELSLALPSFPRASNTSFEGLSAGPPGSTPLTDEAARPFAALASLKDRLENKG